MIIWSLHGGGIQCLPPTEVLKFGPPEYSDVGEAVTAAINDLRERQAGRGTTIMCSLHSTDDIEAVVCSVSQFCNLLEKGS